MQENPENILVVIPARGGSKGIKLKNLKQLLGVSLVGRAIDCAFEIAKKSNVLLSTDHHLILEELCRTTSNHSRCFQIVI